MQEKQEKIVNNDVKVVDISDLEVEEYLNKPESKFIKMKSGEKLEGVITSIKFVKKTFKDFNGDDVEKLCMDLSFDNGKVFSTTNKPLMRSIYMAMKMPNFSLPKKITVLRMGEGLKTTYTAVW